MSFDDIKKAITPIIRQTAIETIESDIRIISKRIGYRTYFRTSRFLNKTKNFTFDNTDVKKVEHYINALTK